jgi:predicted GH43/DUF377 family glycosyl hydrolase
MTDLVARQVAFPGGQKAEVNLNLPMARYPSNPILTAKNVNRVWNDPALSVITVHNAGATRFEEEFLLLFRSHLRRGTSVLGLARSANGINSWRVDPYPVLHPALDTDLFAPGADRDGIMENESGGLEDGRITRIENTYLITYSAYHGRIKNRVRVHLASTKDFVTFSRHGPMIDMDMRNGVLFGEKIGGRYVGLFRPNDVTEGDVGGAFAQIRIGYAQEWESNRWEIEKAPIMKTLSGPSAFSDKIGPGAPPIKTKKGWLNVFHGVRTTMDGHPYVLGVMLHDLNEPAKVKVSSIPILFPTKADCRVGEDDYVHVPNVVFTCGLVSQEDGTLLIYYGGNDTVMNVGLSHVDVLTALCERYGQDPLSGRPLYAIL